MRLPRRSARPTLLLLATLGAGCGTGPLTRTNSDLTALGLPAPASRDDVLRAEEIATCVGINSAEDVIRRLRPQYLHRSGRASPTKSVEPAVYLNMQYYGSLDALARIRPVDIREIRYLALADARQRFGPSVNGAIILVLTW